MPLDQYEIRTLAEFLEENWARFVNKVGSEEEAEKIYQKIKE